VTGRHDINGGQGCPTRLGSKEGRDLKEGGSKSLLGQGQDLYERKREKTKQCETVQEGDVNVERGNPASLAEKEKKRKQAEVRG